MDRKKWIIIGISGVTCGGKTTLANRLKNTLTPVYVFNQDQYFYPDDSPKHIKVEGIDHNNYDVLSSLDMEKMYADVLSTIQGEDKAVDRFVAPTAGRWTIPDKKFIIIEGFTVLNDKNLFGLCDFKYYITLDFGECHARRILRLYEPPDVPGYFDKCVWPCHLRYKREMEQEPTVCFVSGTDPDLLDIIMEQLKSFGLTQIDS